MDIRPATFLIFTWVLDSEHRVIYSETQVLPGERTLFLCVPEYAHTPIVQIQDASDRIYRMFDVDDRLKQFKAKSGELDKIVGWNLVLFNCTSSRPYRGWEKLWVSPTTTAVQWGREVQSYFDDGGSVLGFTVIRRKKVVPATPQTRIL